MYLPTLLIPVRFQSGRREMIKPARQAANRDNKHEEQQEQIEAKVQGETKQHLYNHPCDAGENIVLQQTLSHCTKYFNTIISKRLCFSYVIFLLRLK